MEDDASYSLRINIREHLEAIKYKHLRGIKVDGMLYNEEAFMVIEYYNGSFSPYSLVLSRAIRHMKDSICYEAENLIYFNELVGEGDLYEELYFDSLADSTKELQNELRDLIAPYKMYM